MSKWLYEHVTNALPGRTTINRKSATKPNDIWHLSGIIEKDGHIKYRQFDKLEEQAEIAEYARANHLID